LTDGLIYFSSSGGEPKAFKIKHGLGIKHIQKVGVRYGG
jgi:3-deoxy-D-manno-octulosonate 8-phosphate phosphatase KdsC-like HAD superfamily phosphatase